MANFEKFEQFEKKKNGFDYVEAADLSRQKIELEDSSDKQKKSQIKSKIKELYGSIDTADPDKTPPKRKIFELEMAKQRLIIAQEKGEKPDVKVRPIDYDAQKKMFRFKTKGDYEVKRSAGDLIGDINWDLYYDFESLTSQPDLADFVKDYKAKIYESQIEELEAEQLLIDGIEIDQVVKNNSGLMGAYVKTYKALQDKKAKREKGEPAIDGRSGFVFEKMIRGLLSKLAYDLGVKWDFDISSATVDDDIINKIDAILELRNKRRGIGVEKEPTEGELKKGFQVTTITTGSEEYRKKADQVRKKQEKFQEARALGEKRPVDELVLINPGEEFEDVSSHFKIWGRQGLVAGGPEYFLSIEKAVDTYLKEIFKGTKLDFDKKPEFAEEIRRYFRDKGMKEKEKSK